MHWEAYITRLLGGGGVEAVSNRSNRKIIVRYILYNIKRKSPPPPPVGMLI